jgi:4-carboxymuconolactone decarboxylase
MIHRLVPLDPPYPAEVVDLLATYPHRHGELLTLFRVFANSPRQLAKLGAAGMLDRASPLALAERETVILRTTAHYRCEYEWGVHVTAFAAAAGFNEAQIASTLCERPDLSLWPERLATLIEVCDGLCAGGRVEADVLERMQRHFPADAQLEVLALIGFYHTISNIANTAELAPEAWGRRFAGTV